VEGGEEDNQVGGASKMQNEEVGSLDQNWIEEVINLQ
jgi:hypothetical protein